MTQGKSSELRRREFLKISAAATAGTFTPLGAFLQATSALASPHAASDGLPAANAVKNVRPEIGTGWRGHMFPGAVAPFGLVQLSPDTAGGPEPQWNARGDYTGWDHCPGYYYPDNVVHRLQPHSCAGNRRRRPRRHPLMPIVEGNNWAWEAGVPPYTALHADSGTRPELRLGLRQTVPGYSLLLLA